MPWLLTLVGSAVSWPVILVGGAATAAALALNCLADSETRRAEQAHRGAALARRGVRRHREKAFRREAKRAAARVRALEAALESAASPEEVARLQDLLRQSRQA